MQIMLPMMKPLLIFILAGSFVVHPGSSLKCYTCSYVQSNDKCKVVRDCQPNEMCKTDVIGVKGLFSIISKECSSSCKSDFKDFTVGKRNITCCSSDHCNVSGARSIQMSYAQVALAVFASFSCLFLRSGR